MRAAGSVHLLVVLGLALVLASTTPATSAGPAEPSEESDADETVVVTASRSEQSLEDAPAAVTVIEGARIERAAPDSLADPLRGVPGLNVAQTSALGLSVSGRRATGAIPSGQLVLVDNRKVYQDFNGAVLWGALPVSRSEIDRVEVLRGPGSAVWGANALDGVVHILTKSPAEMQGTRVTLAAGERKTRYADLVHAGVHGKLGYKISAAWYEQDPYQRPTGTIPGTDGPTNPGGTPYPDYENEGTEQPKLHLRLDYEQDDRTTWSFSTGYAAVSGIALAPFGPFAFDDDSYEGFAQIDWRRDSARVTLFANRSDLHGANRLSGVRSSGTEATYDLDYDDHRKLGTRHELTFGANLRRAVYDNSDAPRADDRDRRGVFLQDEIRLSERIHWTLGARWDHIDPMGSAISPRTSLSFTPIAGQTLRLSYGRAYRAPTIIENFLDVQAAQVIQVPTPGGPLDLVFPLSTTGNPDLEEERLDSLELGWTAALGRRVLVSLAVYRAEIDGLIRLVPASFWSSAEPPPGWPLDPALLDIPPPDGFAGIPSSLTFVNLGEVVNRGVELSAELRPADAWTLFAGYSWQDEPDASDLPPETLPDGRTVDPVNVAPDHRFDAGATWSRGRWYVTGNVDYQSEAFWTDVLDSRFWGPTDSFFQVHAGAGVRLVDDALELSLRAQNLFDAEVQQHVWGDLLGRKLTVEVAYRF